MKLTHYNDHVQIPENAFLWRYMSYEKLYDILINNNLYFTRFDCFNDPLEGLTSSQRFFLNLQNEIKYCDEDDTFRTVSESTKKSISKSTIASWQQGNFASCWYLTSDNTESQAMWELYGKSDGFALKIKLQTLVELTESSIAITFEDTEITEANYGMVEYKSIVEDILSKTGKIEHRGLIKDSSYKHEMEFRFILSRSNRNPKIEDRDGIKIRIKTLKESLESIEIYSHAEMSELKHNLYQDEFGKHGYELKHSKNLTKNVVNDILNKLDT